MFTSRLIFRPSWLDNIQPLNPIERSIDDPVYPPSKLTAHTVNSSQGSMVSGLILDAPTRSREAQAARKARKAHGRAEMSDNRNKVDRMIVKAERRAAKEARRIMMDNRRLLRDLFTKEEV
jgi:hypothetical protein